MTIPTGFIGICQNRIREQEADKREVKVRERERGLHSAVGHGARGF